MSTTRDRWRSIVDGHESSGLTVAEYCDHCRISSTSFYRWRRLLGGRQAELSRIPGTSGALVPIELDASTRLRPPAFVEAIVGRAAELTSPAPVIEVGRWRIVVPEGFDQITLGRVVATLDGLDLDGDIDGQADVPPGHGVDFRNRAVSSRAKVRP